MSAELIGIFAVGLAAAALIMTRILSLRKLMRAEIRHLPGHAGGLLGRASAAAHKRAPAAGGPLSERATAADVAQADPSPEQDRHDVPAPRDGKKYDPRPPEDKARRRIAYLLIALLAVQVNALTTMVLFDVISIDDVKEFSVIISPLVALVSAATGFYFATKGR